MSDGANAADANGAPDTTEDVDAVLREIGLLVDVQTMPIDLWTRIGRILRDRTPAVFGCVALLVITLVSSHRTPERN